jgi:hypothetical protein
MRKALIGIVTSASVAFAPCALQAAPVRPADAVVAGGATLALAQGVQSGRSSATTPGHSGKVNWAQVGLALGLTGTALAAFILLHKGSSSPRT